MKTFALIAVLAALGSAPALADDVVIHRDGADAPTTSKTVETHTSSDGCASKTVHKENDDGDSKTVHKTTCD